MKPAKNGKKGLTKAARRTNHTNLERAHEARRRRSEWRRLAGQLETEAQDLRRAATLIRERLAS